MAHHKHGEDESVGDEQTLMCPWLAGVLVSWEWFALMLTAGTRESCLGCHEARIRRLMRQGHGTYQGRVEARGGPYLISNSRKELSRESGGSVKSAVLKTMPMAGVPFCHLPHGLCQQCSRGEHIERVTISQCRMGQEIKN